MRKVYLEGILGKKYGSEWNLAVNSPSEALTAIMTQRPGMRQFITKSEGIQGYEVLIGEEGEGVKQWEDFVINDPSMSQSYSFVPVIGGSKNAGLMIVLGVALIVMTGGAAAIGLAGMMGSAAVPVGAIATTAQAATISTAMGLTGTAAITAGTTITASMSVAVSTAAIAGTTAGYALAGASYLGMGLLLGGASMLLTPDTPSGDNAKQAENYLFSGPINTVKQGEPIPLVYGRAIVGSKTIMGSLFTTSSRAKIDKSRKLVGIGGFREDGSTWGNTAPAGRYSQIDPRKVKPGYQDP
tara:strand:- start:98 stop:991 length:894 start_codon:yes stop_codon:yes gene_type:complete